LNDLEILEEIAKIKRPIISFPWDNATEDQWAAREAVKILYASLSLPAPRMAWAASPATMYRASRMLRSVQAGGSYNMVQALVPQGPDRIEREAKVSLLAMMIDPDVSTQSGGLIIKMIEDVFGKGGESHPALNDLRSNLSFKNEDPSGTWAPATFREQSMWPAFYPGFTVPRLSALRRQSIILMPFAKLVWFCRPPLYIRTDELGRLHAVGEPAAAWADGFEVYCDRTPKDKMLEVHAETKALPESTE